MYLDRNTECRRNFSSKANYEFKRLFVERRPDHGNVSLSEGGIYTYRPANNFTGSDEFSLKVCGSVASTEVKCAIIVYKVTIQ